MSAFENWFVAQFGQRFRSEESDLGLNDIVVAGENAKRELERRAAWDAKRSSALYAWQIDDEAKAKWKDRPSLGLVRAAS